MLIIAKMRMVALKAGWQQQALERKITLMVMMVVMVFVICWMPFYVVQLVNVFAEQDDATVSQLSVILGYFNSCANPILFYGFLFRQLRSFQLSFASAGWNNAAEEPVDYYATPSRAALTAWRTSSPRTWSQAASSAMAPARPGSRPSEPRVRTGEP